MIKTLKNRKGFTLVELLAVIVILAIIMVITIPTVLSSMNKSKEKAFNTSVQAIQNYINKQVENCKSQIEFISYEKSLFEEGTCNLLIDSEETKNKIINLSGYKNELTDMELDDNNEIVVIIGVGQFQGFEKNLLSYDESCWKTELLEDGTYKLTEFYGINNDGSINDICSGYVRQDRNNLYSITIPSKIENKNITVIGNNIFNAVIVDENLKFNAYNNYQNIKSIKINDGITKIEDGNINYIGTFLGIGTELIDENADFINTNVKVKNDLSLKLPKSLKYIGDGAFAMTTLKEIIIPSNVEEIGILSFSTASDIEKINFEGTDDNTSNLKIIGEYAFFSHLDVNNTKITSITIPSNVEKIGDFSFLGFRNLEKINFKGADDNTSNLNFIGQAAFSNCNLNYTKQEDPLIIPSSVKTIGRVAFGSKSSFTNDEPGNHYLKYIKFNGILNNDNPSDWYTSIDNGGVTTLIK